MNEELDDVLQAALATPAEGQMAEGTPPESTEDAGDGAPDVAALVEAKQKADEGLARCQEEVRVLTDQLTRMAADFANVRKRSEREREETARFANERLVNELLPVLDNFDRAFTTAGAVEGPAKAVVDGVALVRDQLHAALGRFGVTAFSTRGEPFNPERAEAVSTRPEPGAAPNTVVDELRRGYLLHDRLLRPALVVVASEDEANGDN